MEICDIQRHIPTLVSLWRGNGRKERLDKKEISALSSSLLKLQRGLTGERKMAGGRYMSEKDRQDHYEIIAGERRWRAAMKAGLKEIPAIIRNYSEQEIVEIALIENIQREDLTPIEEALAYKKLMDEFHMKHDQVAERVSKSRTAVTNSIRLLKLCKKVQEMVENGMITAGHARAIISVEDPDKQYELAQRIFDEKLNVREVEKIIKKMNEPAKEGKAKPDTSQFDAIYENLAEKMKQTLGTKVSITSKGQGAGKIEIEFYSNEDLERIMELIH